MAKPEKESIRGGELQNRVAGLLLAAMGIAFAVFPAYWIYDSGWPNREGQLGPAGKPLGNWGSVALTLLVALLGCYLAIKPEAIIAWSRKTARHLPLESSPGYGTLVVVRLVGILVLAFASYLLGKN